MNVFGEYRRKLRSADEAVKVVKSGDWVDYSTNLGFPALCDAALAKRRDELTDVKVRGNLIFGPVQVVECDPAREHFVYNTWHCSGYERRLCDAGLCNFIPMVFRNLAWYYREFLTVNVAMMSVTPMDKHGYFNLSCATGVGRAVLDKADVIILEVNEALPVILRELPADVSRVCLVGRADPEEREAVDAVAADRSLFLEYAENEVGTEAGLLALARSAEHIVILNRHELEPEEADMQVVFLLLNLRDIRQRYGLRFNLTVEMRRERNQLLAGYGDRTDFIVSSSMSSLILAQLAENPELYGVFKEILSNAGNEIYIKNAGQLRLTGRHTVRALRRRMLGRGYVLLGRLDESGSSAFNPPLDAELTLAEEDGLIVIGES